MRAPKTKGIPIDIIGSIKYSDFTDWPSMYISQIPDSKHFLKIKWEMIDGTKGVVGEKSPFVKINVNGISIDAVVDTGASITTIPFKMARDLDVHQVSIVDSGAGSMYRRHMRAGLARVESLDIAGFRFHNAMISVADVPRPIIGLVQLIKLNRVVLYKDHLQVIGRSNNSKRCKKYMYFSGDLTGPPSTIKITTMVNGHVEHPVMDTGFGGTFQRTVHQMRNGLGEKFLSHDAVGNKRLVGYWTHATIETGNSDRRVRGSVVLYKKRQAGYRFGAQLIKKIGPLYLDFDSGRACFLAK